MVYTIGTFTIVKNEVEYIGYHIMSLLPHVDLMVFADGNSTDGTVELIKYIKNKYDKHDKIRLFENKDCKNLEKDYERLFNWTLKKCNTDYCFFIHPDMIVMNPDNIKDNLNGALRYNVNMRSYAGENRDKIIVEGRAKQWATIYRNKFGLHFYGYYGSHNEDFYFSDMTGKEHQFYKHKEYLPYMIDNTNIVINHYCDCKPYERRYDRMLKCLKHLFFGYTEQEYEDLAKGHPRVKLEDGVFNKIGFQFKKVSEIELPVFKKYKTEFNKFIGGAKK